MKGNPGAITISPATAGDQAVIKRMIREEQLDPSSLNWRQFMVARDHDQGGLVVGIGQVKVLPGAYELGSLVVKSDYRGRGIAGQLIAALEANAPRPLYLLCLQETAPLYERHGYRRIKISQAPLVLRLKISIPILIYRGKYKFIIMVKEA